MPTQKDFSRFRGVIIHLKSETNALLFSLTRSVLCFHSPNDNMHLLVSRTELERARFMLGEMCVTVDDALAMYDTINSGEKP